MKENENYSEFCVYWLHYTVLYLPDESDLRIVTPKVNVETDQLIAQTVYRGGSIFLSK